jgi:hypothetical protein
MHYEGRHVRDTQEVRPGVPGGAVWAGDGGEGAKFWLAVLTEIKTVAPAMSASWSATG